MATDKSDNNFESALFDKLFPVKSMKMGTPLDVSVDESSSPSAEVRRKSYAHIFPVTVDVTAF